MDMRIKDAFDGLNHSGVIVTSDTEAQVKRAIRAIEYYLDSDRVPGGHIILIEDEADAMYRTVDSKQKFEQAHLRLQKLASVVGYCFTCEHLAKNFYVSTHFIFH